MGVVNTSTNAATTQPGNNTLVTIASDGTALVAWYDGTNQQVSYASSPYSSWIETELQAAFRFVCAMMIVDGSGDVGAITADNVQGSNYYLLSKSGATYSVGSPTAIGFVGTFSPGQPQMIALDQQGRVWSISNTNNGTACEVWYSATPTTASSWINSLNATTTNDAHMPAGDLVGNYLIVLYYTSGQGIQYQRVDVHASTIGSWSSATTVSLTGSPGNTTHASFRGNGAGVGCLAYTSGSGIYAALYTASTDTWGVATQLSSSGSDTSPNVIADGSGNLYVFWCAFNSTNNYSLVYKEWNGSSWDSSATTVVGSGSNITNPNAGYGNNTIGILYTTGTSSPYNVNFTTIALAPTSNVMASTDTLALADSWLFASVAIPVDTVPASDSFLATDQAQFADMELASDSFLATDQALWAESIPASDSFAPIEIGIMASTDVLALADSWAFTDVAMSTDAVPASDGFAATDWAQFADVVPTSDSFSWMQATPQERIVWVTRDNIMIWRTRG